MTERLCRLCQRPEADDDGAAFGAGIVCPECGYYRLDSEREGLVLRAAREAIATWREARRHRQADLARTLHERAVIAVARVAEGSERLRLEGELLDVHEGPPPR